MGISSRQEIKPESPSSVLLYRHSVSECAHFSQNPRRPANLESQPQFRIDCIPAEILSEIFLHCGPFVSYHPRELILSLTQVSRQWRAVAFATLELWACLRIVWDSPSIAIREGAPLHLCNSWLQRAGSYPLLISIHGKDVLRFMNPVRDIVLPNSLRIRALELDYEPRISRTPGFGHYPCGFSGLEVLPGKSLPNLVFASFNFTDRQAPIFSSRSVAIQSATRLRYLDLQNSSYRLDYDLLPVPWYQITHLTLNDPCSNPNDCSAIFLQCTNLISCRLTILIWTDERVPSGEEIVMPYLEELALHVVGHSGRHATSGEMSPLYHRMVLPALIFLNIRHFNVVDKSQGALFHLLSRSSSPLEEVVLESVLIMPEQFISLLQHTPHLKRLNLTGFHNMEEVLWDMFYWKLLKETQRRIVPKLETIVINIIHPKEDQDDSCLKETELEFTIPKRLLDFIDDRWKLSRLRKLVFAIGVGVDRLVPEVRNRLIAWRERGLDVVIY